MPSGLRDGQLSLIDPSGRWVVGEAWDAAGSQHLLLWDSGVVRDLGDAEYGFADINPNGEAIVASYDGSASVGWRYHDGQLTRLPPLQSGDDVVLYGMNDNGVVVGLSTGQEGYRQAGFHQTPVVWSADNNPTALQMPPGDNSGWVADIDDAGTVVGAVGYDPRDLSEPTWEPVEWRADGSMRVLPGPEDGQEHAIWPRAITQTGTIGQEMPPQQYGKVWRWGSAAAAPTYVTDGRVDAISTTGSIAYSTLASDGAGADYWLLHDGVRHPLPYQHDEPITPLMIVGVSDSNVVYGWYRSVPMRWSCP
ncbi:hypothetical protein Raf01_49410 [Rugosimonospora africana]|uniref:Uncharacterized protein n=1 Tax=Rugosimonospora africana TaxID=556532 RepID=A0A8J3QUJ2_9ACTN|nr:hypothetical protein Raf01_49410 [Rugosimonospora africana]